MSRNDRRTVRPSRTERRRIARYEALRAALVAARDDPRPIGETL